MAVVVRGRHPSFLCLLLASVRLAPHSSSVVGLTRLPLDQTNIRDLTRAFTRSVSKPPTCRNNWESRLGSVLVRFRGMRLPSCTPIAWLPPKIGSCITNLYAHELSLPKRGKLGNYACRCCKQEVEHIEHWVVCCNLREIFKIIDGLTGDTSPRSRLFGLRPDRRAIRYGSAARFLMIWKSLLISLTQCGIEGKTVRERHIFAKRVRH